MGPRIVVYALLLAIGFGRGVTLVECNLEVDTLYAWKSKLVDPNNVLESWEERSTSPCTWFHVTCNSRNRVTRVDLGSAGLSGSLIAELGLLADLRYFEVFDNRISGFIPSLFGNLTNLISLELQDNILTGSIPSTLGNLRYLKYLRLNNNNITGILPLEVIQLVRWGNLAVLDVSLNQLEGTIDGSNVTATTIIQDPRAPW